MSDIYHRTDTICTYKPVKAGAQKTHWIEFQLLDELGAPLANLPWRMTNEAVRTGCISAYQGQTDAQGVIRLEGLLPLDVTLRLAADPLATVLQHRRLRAHRAEPARPGIGDRTPLYGPQRPGFSPIEKEARAQGHDYHYLRIGQLCDGLPAFNVEWPKRDKPPAYHFPDPSYSGFTALYENLNRRHVLEVCPLRAWSLILHHQREYSLANAYNLGLMSSLAYSTIPKDMTGSVSDFFMHQCLDLSRTPAVRDGRKYWPTLVTDVPFDARYDNVKLLDTSKVDTPEGDTQLFYAISASQVLVAWRGTEFTGWSLPDLVTDLTLRPVEPPGLNNCQARVSCPSLVTDGRVHLGFLNAFGCAQRSFTKVINRDIPNESQSKDLFICGHSLGGALGLIHSASVKIGNPLLYTYGMPRTFTLRAIKELADIPHFRHVNDIDTIPSVPPEADLDNHLYELYGPLGTVLGFTWSLGQTAASQLITFGDPYCHHGEVAMFYRVTQHTRSRGSPYQAQGSKDGLGAPYYNTVDTRLPNKATLHVVPCLSKKEEEEAEKGQRQMVGALNAEARARFFPPHKNLKTGRLLGIGHHFMANYMSPLRSRLLEAINPTRDPLLNAQLECEAFKLQMVKYAENAIQDEVERNQAFMSLHEQVNETLEVTSAYKGGADALIRFDVLACKQSVMDE